MSHNSTMKVQPGPTVGFRLSVSTTRAPLFTSDERVVERIEWLEGERSVATDIETDLMLARAEIATLKADLAALTARAAKAEQERDRAIEDLSTARGCVTCAHIQDQKYCYKYCHGHVDVNYFRTYPCWQWRGLPQKGE